MKILLIAVAVIVLIVVLFFAWIYLKVLLMRRINYVFSDLVKEGDLEQAQNCFQRTIEAAPRFLAYNQTLISAAINLGDVESAQSVRNLRSFFNKIADIYLKFQPQSHFANIFAVGIKKRSDPQLAKQCIERAMRRDPSWLLCSIGCMVTRDFDICSSALMGRDALVKMPDTAKYADRRVSTSIALAKTLEIAGADRAASICLQQCAKEVADYSLQRCTEVDLIFSRAYFKQALGEGTAAAILLAKINTVDIYTPYLVLKASLIFLANHKPIKALQCLNELSKHKESDLPLWYTDGVKACISVVSYITSLYEQDQYDPDPAILDLHLKNLKDAANAYHDIKYMQILAADACICAGKKRQALLYLERAEKLSWQPIEEITELSGTEIEDDSSQSTLAALILNLSILHLSDFNSVERAIWQLHMDLDQADDALALARRTIRQDTYDSPLEEAWWQSRAYLAAQALKKPKEAQEYLAQALKSLADYEEANHIEGPLVPIDKLFATLAQPRSFGSAEYHLLKTGLVYVNPQHTQEDFNPVIIDLFRTMRDHPHNLSILRFLSEIVIMQGPSPIATHILNNLKECYTTVNDLYFLRKLKEIGLPIDSDPEEKLPTSAPPVNSEEELTSY